MSLFSEEDLNINSEYRVLARKYRPQNFSDMIGQDILVKTFVNAVKTNRIAHAFLLTGIRGVGKTTTARIIAKALNCLGTDGQSGITAEPCNVCANCTAISAGSFHDVLEIDAASHTGVDDIREITESVRYKPISGRFKVFIIDEVHMLSNNAFNALLKTLEEPPAYVKFVFATTETRKIPLTILSRCQRFDLKRVEPEILAEFFTKVLTMEGFQAEADAVKLISTVAAGSVRDGLSILDQAISNSEGNIKAQDVRDMLGLADSTKMLALYDAITDGNCNKSLDLLKEIYNSGADAILIAQELLAINHTTLKAKVAPSSIQVLPEYEATFYRRVADPFNTIILSRIHTQIIRGIEEIRLSHIPAKTLEVLVIRIIHSAHLPALNEFISNSNNAPTSNSNNGLSSQTIVKAALPTTFDSLLEVLKNAQEVYLATQMTKDVAFVKLEGTKLYLKFLTGADALFSKKISTALKEATNQSWEVIAVEDSEAVSIYDQEKLKQNEYIDSIKNDEGVKGVLEAFGEGEIAEINNLKVG